jgi:CubicO group peptidase (beta-lactamase class C family)
MSWIGAAQDQESDPRTIEELKAHIQRILIRRNVPGASIALVDREKTLWAGGIGKADVAAGTEVTEKTLFRVGSISKSFTALAVLMLVEEGRLDLNAPVRDLVPEIEFTNPWQETHPVRVAHLMEHTTGFDDIHPREYLYKDNASITLLEGLAFNPNSRRCRWKPGQHRSYCNSGPAIAAYILEKVTGRVFEEFVRERIFDVLGMRHSSFHFPMQAELMAKGYEADGTTEAGYDHIIVRPSGALNASADEMARFIRMLINRGALDDTVLVKPETITRMERPKTTLAARAGFTFGYGLGNFASFQNGFTFHGHNGGITGFVSTYAYSSDLGLGFFASINKSSPALGDIRRLVAKFLTSGLDRPKVPEFSFAESDLGEAAGYYQLITPRQQIQHVIGRFWAFQHVTLEEGRLYLQSPRRELIPVSANSFRFAGQPEANMFNIRNEEGALIGQWGALGNYQKVPRLWIIFQVGAAILSIILMVTSIVFALIWIPLKLLGKMPDAPYLRCRTYPLLAVLSLITGLLPFAISSNMVADFGALSIMSLLVFFGTLLFALFTLLSLYTIFRSFAVKMSRVIQVHSILVTLACVTVLIYLWSCGMIGIRGWAY